MGNKPHLITLIILFLTYIYINYLRHIVLAYCFRSYHGIFSLVVCFHLFDTSPPSIFHIYHDCLSLLFDFNT
jgi:hypothetical protein